MQGGDSCRLIAVNLFSFVEEPFTKKAKFNFKKFYEVVYETQRLMDDLVDLELEAVEKILDKIEADPEVWRALGDLFVRWKLKLGKEDLL